MMGARSRGWWQRLAAWVLLVVALAFIVGRQNRNIDNISETRAASCAVFVQHGKDDQRMALVIANGRRVPPFIDPRDTALWVEATAQLRRIAADDKAELKTFLASDYCSDYHPHK